MRASEVPADLAEFFEVVPSGDMRDVFEIATQPYPEAHFATYPEELVRRCLLAGCPEWVCRVCGKPRERIVERESTQHRDNWAGENRGNGVVTGGGHVGRHGAFESNTQTLGWSDCGCGNPSHVCGHDIGMGCEVCEGGHANYRPGIVLDPFMGSGTTAHVARKHGRHAIGIDLNADYLKLAAKRLQQQSLFAEGVS